MNVTRHELPEENPHSLGAFLTATAVYTTVLLVLGFYKHSYVHATDLAAG